MTEMRRTPRKRGRGVTDTDTDTVAAAPKRRPRRSRRFLRFLFRLTMMIVVPGVAVFVGAYFFVTGQNS